MMKKRDLVAKLIFIDLLGTFIEFPLWWYSTGLKNLFYWLQQELVYRYRQYAFSIWIRNFFVPMYGQYDWTSRLISVLMRLVVIILRFIALILEAILYFLLLFIWMVIPPFAGLMIVRNILHI